MSQNVSLNQISLTEQFQRLFAAAREERFEDGMESNFSHHLLALLEKYGASAYDALGSLILESSVNMEAAAEACRWLGRLEDPKNHTTRRTWLESILQGGHSARVRDGAALGLASMDDPASIPAFQQAIEREVNTELRHDLQQVLDQLIETQHERV